MKPQIASALFLLCCSLSAQVNFNLAPTTISNTYDGTITLTVTGLNTGESVLVQKYFDANTNGVVDGADILVQQFGLTDGNGGMVIGGVTNYNVPGDTDTVAGRITAKLMFGTNTPSQSIVGQYLYVASSPTGRWPAQTNAFAITNFPFGQTLTGTVLSNGTSAPLPYAGVLVFPPPRQGHGLGQIVAGTMANSAGVYSIQVPVGSYMLFPFKSNYLCDTALNPVVSLGSGATVATNLSLSNATATISGSLVDASNSAIGLPAMLIDASYNGIVAIGFSGSNGNFTMGVQATGTNQWGLSADSDGFGVLGYVQPQNKGSAAPGATGVVMGYPKGNALIYGSVADSLGHPFAGVDVNISDQSALNFYDEDVYTDANGHYVAAVVGSGGGDAWQAGLNTSTTPANYVFTTPGFDQNGGTNLNAGTATQANFTGLLATNLITGQVLFEGDPVANVQVYAFSNDTNNFYTQANTDGGGHYSLSVGNGDWSVNVSCQGGNNSLDSILGNGTYTCPDGTNVSIENANGAADFNIQGFTTFLNGQVVDDSGQPVMNMNIFAQTNGTTFSATTDSGGNFHMGIANGTYTVFLNNDPNSGFPSLGLVGPTLTATVANNVTVNNLYLVCKRVTGMIQVQVNGTGNAGVSGIGVFANLPIGSTNYGTGPEQTDGSGAAAVPVCNGNWQVNLNGNDVQNAGYSPPNGQDANIVNNTIMVTFNLSTGGSGGSLQINTGFLPSATKGVFYSQTFQASGGSPPYSWSIPGFSAAPPPGLVLSNNGVFFGTPTTAGTNYIDVVVRDSAGNSNEEDGLQIVVNPSASLSITNLSLPNGNVGKAYSDQLGAVGGNPPYTWSLSLGSAALPTGLSLSPSGLISGTPTTNGLFSFKAQVVDTTSDTNKEVFGLIINPRPTLSLPAWAANRFSLELNGAANQNYTIQVTTNVGSTNWATLIVTNNSATNSYLIADPAATNKQRFYRALIGP